MMLNSYLYGTFIIMHSLSLRSILSIIGGMWLDYHYLYTSALLCTRIYITNYISRSTFRHTLRAKSTRKHSKTFEAAHHSFW